MKIDLPLFYPGWRGFKRVVEAEIVDVAPHIPGTFAVHRCPDDGGWKVSNVETGCLIGMHRDYLAVSTKQEAVAFAVTFLADKTASRYEKGLRNAIRDYPEIRS